MDLGRVGEIVRYAVALASENDDWSERDLGPIHLIKYAFLADLAYARKHAGQTYTGADWVFHHFGPWDLELFQSLEGLLTAPFRRNQYLSNYDRDAVRWSLPSPDPNLLRQAEKALPLVCSQAVWRGVRTHRNNTKSLLQEVYRTDPMLAAEPGDHLIFGGEVEIPSILTKSEENKALKRKLKRTMEKIKANRVPHKKGWRGGPQAHFAQGLADLESLEDGSVPETEIMEVYLDPSIWTWGLRESHG